MKLNVNSRDIVGKKVARLRKENIIPCVVYGKHKEDHALLSCDKNEFIKLFKKTGQTTPIILHGEGIEQLALIHEIKLDPVTDFLMHIDFLAVRRDEKVTANVQIILVGESPLQKLGEGNIQLIKDSIEVEAFPQDLPHNVEIDISEMKEMTDVIFVKDLKLGNKVEIIDDPEQALVTVMALTEEVEEEVVSELPLENEVKATTEEKKE